MSKPNTTDKKIKKTIINTSQNSLEKHAFPNIHKSNHSNIENTTGYHLLYAPSAAHRSDTESLSSNIGDHLEIAEQPREGYSDSGMIPSATHIPNNNSFVGDNFYSKGMLHGPDTEISDSVKFLEGTHHLFFRHCNSFPPEISSFNPKNKRGIWNSSGRVVYYTGLKKSYICRGCHSGFVYQVVDYSGNMVIIATGKQFRLGLTSSVKIELEPGKILGTMYQSCLSSTYIIKDSTGRIVFKIQAPCFAPCAPFVFWSCREHFEICLDDGVTEIGKITKYWGNDVDAPEFQSCLGIEMERVDDVRVKALLLGCFFLIEFQYYRLGGNGPIFFIFMLLIFAGVSLLVICFKPEFEEYCPFWPSSVEKKARYL
ncbi:unnamed protein product [Orchesella dallaii]|uniref:Phospholipid scramblase n=1 Tax=Orchesella dallaii TaxID=48710 RepID=A0ABP1Q895_9HEXA